MCLPAGHGDGGRYGVPFHSRGTFGGEHLPILPANIMGRVLFGLPTDALQSDAGRARGMVIVKTMVNSQN